MVCGRRFPGRMRGLELLPKLHLVYCIDEYFPGPSPIERGIQHGARVLLPRFCRQQAAVRERFAHDRQ